MHPVRSCHRTIFTDVANDYHPYRQEKTQIYLPTIRIMITWSLKAHKQTFICARAHIFAEEADKLANGSTLRLISLGDTNEKQTVRCVFDKQRIFIRKRENMESTIVVHYISSGIKKMLNASFASFPNKMTSYLTFIRIYWTESEILFGNLQND